MYFQDFEGSSGRIWGEAWSFDPPQQCPKRPQKTRFFIASPDQSTVPDVEGQIRVDTTLSKNKKEEIGAALLQPLKGHATTSSHIKYGSLYCHLSGIAVSVCACVCVCVWVNVSAHHTLIRPVQHD